jgi:hypothetical protein
MAATVQTGALPAPNADGKVYVQALPVDMESNRDYLSDCPTCGDLTPHRKDVQFIRADVGGDNFNWRLGTTCQNCGRRTEKPLDNVDLMTLVKKSAGWLPMAEPDTVQEAHRARRLQLRNLMPCGMCSHRSVVMLAESVNADRFMFVSRCGRCQWMTPPREIGREGLAQYSLAGGGWERRR